MPKTLPNDIKQDLIDPYSGGAWFLLCEISVPSYDTFRIARNTEQVTYDGNVYEPANFDVSDQTFSSDGSLPRLTLRVAHDANKTLETIMNSSSGAEGGTVKLIKVCSKFLSTSVPALEATYGILAPESDETGVSLLLGPPNKLSQTIPIRSYNSSGCPYATSTLFKGVECGYSGADSSCTGLYDDCRTKGNAARFGGDLGLDPNGNSL